MGGAGRRLGAAGSGAGWILVIPAVLVLEHQLISPMLLAPLSSELVPLGWTGRGAGSGYFISPVGRVVEAPGRGHTGELLLEVLGGLRVETVGLGVEAFVNV